MERLPVETGADGAGSKFKAIGGVERRLRGWTMSGIVVGEVILWLIVALIVIVVAVTS